MASEEQRKWMRSEREREKVSQEKLPSVRSCFQELLVQQAELSSSCLVAGRQFCKLSLESETH